jgi:hypothetical protein
MHLCLLHGNFMLHVRYGFKVGDAPLERGQVLIVPTMAPALLSILR